MDHQYKSFSRVRNDFFFSRLDACPQVSTGWLIETDPESESHGLDNIEIRLSYSDQKQ